jgi:hypothetical protein
MFRTYYALSNVAVVGASMQSKFCQQVLPASGWQKFLFMLATTSLHAQLVIVKCLVVLAQVGAPCTNTTLRTLLCVAPQWINE